ncbi:hypothetical protein M231_04993 [Tremella mesenterica]|uniref:Phosphoribulokinase/uridine kinase domain-containing protein n=1 Tax=Tremella mesenterica TaxID=5217 RepID=A0A4Q1BJ69_TREME|nr:hypothetical protein M231_04993 [Tremella mesenterica]
MDAEVKRLAQKAVDLYKSKDNSRILICIGGPPGCGKSTLAFPLVDKINSLLSSPPTHHPSIVDSSTALATQPQESPDKPAVSVSLDGWHYPRAILDTFPDPQEAHYYRGAPFTFDVDSYLKFVQKLKQDTEEEVGYFEFDHALKDPTPAPRPITRKNRIVVIEGLYCLLDEDKWRDAAEMMDLKIFVEVDEEVERERLIERNYKAGLASTRELLIERVDASDMRNGRTVRSTRVTPTDIVWSIQDPSHGK